MMELFGGVPCLDFANTLDGRATAAPEELLNSYGDLVGWSALVGFVEPATVRRLARTAPAAAEAALRTAKELREAIFQVFAAVGRGERVPEDALAVLQRRYAEAMSAARLAPDGSGWSFGGDAPDRAWWPVTVSAIQLLTGGPLDRVKVCASEDGCIGLFLDTSKNRSRRWCTMEGCGVEAKVLRQAKRRRMAARRTG